MTIAAPYTPKCRCGGNTPSFITPPQVEGVGETLLRIERARLAHLMRSTWKEDFEALGKLDLLEHMISWIGDAK